MPTVNNIYSYCADYSGMNGCLFAIQELYDQGDFSNYPDLINLIKAFEADALKRLFVRTFTLFGIVKDIKIDQSFIEGDFTVEFSGNDYYIGQFFDRTNTGFSSKFKTITNVFSALCSDLSITQDQRNYLEEALSEVLDLFDQLRDYLEAYGFNPCGSLPGISYRNNSSFIHVQAAGSDGNDGVAAGIHLRWGLDGHMGDYHLPQGTFANGEADLKGYRKENDFVKLHRIKYENTAPVVVDFQQLKPIINPALFQWTYLINSSTDVASFKNRIRLIFGDQEQYASLSTTTDPSTNPFEFLSAYSGILEIENLEKTYFTGKLNFRKQAQQNSARLLLEANGKIKRGIATEIVPLIRKSVTLTSQVSEVISLTGDNLSILKLKKDAGSYIDRFEFETYHDFLETRQLSDWTEVGNGFALSLNDAEVLKRLEEPGVYAIDNLWPHYNDGAKVKVSNYQDKWSVDRPFDPALKTVLQDYLILSRTDPKALTTLGSADDPELPGLKISYLDMLNMVAVDFHIARMLGLGHIDTPVGTNEEKWLYKVSYQNRKGELFSQQYIHEYLSVPTSRLDYRIAAKPKLKPLQYRLGASDGYSNEMFDEQGYSRTDRTRVVNIGRAQFPSEALNEDFWLNGQEQFNVIEQAYPVLYGIEYRSDTQSSYVKPEITFDSGGDDHIYYVYDQTSPVQIPEPVPVPDNADSLYTHFEVEEGIHHYAAYAINIFSRVSEVSDEVGTDDTDFPVKNRLPLPTDISLQYIQEEDTLLFTTQKEQDWLANRIALFPGMDVSFTRLTFNWIDMIDISDYTDIQQLVLADIVKANKIKAYFKPDEVFEVRGSIANVRLLDDVDQALVEITGYTMLNGEEQHPTIPSNKYGSFQGSWLSTPSGMFEIISVEEHNNRIQLLIRKQLLSEAVPSEIEEEFNRDSLRSVPVYGERFSFTENMGVPPQWENIINTVDIIDLSNPNQPNIETEIDSDGIQTHVLVGGLSNSALITALDEDNDQVPDLPGYYRVLFQNGVSLAAHPQINLPFDELNPGANNPSGLEAAHVEWYKGCLRVPYANQPNQKKPVQVLRIVSLDPLELIIYDPVALQEPEAIKVSTDVNDQIPVNFHPGYKVYLFTEPSPAQFNSMQLEPEPSANERKVLFGLQSTSNTFSSRISVPTIFMVRKIIRPVQLEEILVPRLRVRPDQKGRAAFTFDRKIPLVNGLPRAPFGFMFFRLSSQELLEALYAPQTFEAILSSLNQLEEDPFSDQRFYELVNLIFDPDNVGHFKVFDATPAPYGFPDPDRPGLIESGDNQLQRLNKYRAAIRTELLPLTEQPPIYKFIKEGQHTENKEPVIHDLDGNLLADNDSRFYPFPMVRRYKLDNEAEIRIRFTDYNLRGSSRFFYFYTAAEITNQLVIGPLSSFTGPVGILHTAPDIAPNVLRYDQLTGMERGIRFELAELAENKTVTKIRLYRAYAKESLSMLSNFDDFVDVDFVVNDNNSITLIDVLDGIIFGKTVHFRLAAVRRIINELGEEENVISLPSEIISINLIDSSNPDAPELTYSLQENKLTWPATLNKGSYYLYKQQPTGNWRQIHVVTEVGPGLISYALTSPLPNMDEVGNRIYHRFKVKALNTSGLFNLIEKELTI